MPEYKSKSYKKSKSSKNSKSGGRRRKHTMRKYRRGRKVMRGGGVAPSNPNLNEKMSKFYQITEVENFLKENNLSIPVNISDMTYLDIQKHVYRNDFSTDEPTTSQLFNDQFRLPSPN